MKIIILSAKARHGKDTFYELAKEQLESKGKKVIRMAYGDLVKYVCNQYFGATYEHNEENRYIWQNVGTNRVRENLKMPTYWVDQVCNFIKMTEGMYDYVFITDARFPNEIDIPKSTFKNVITVRIQRDNFKSNLSETQLKHVSEVALDNYEFDHYIKNNSSLEAFSNKVTRFVSEVLHE